MLSRRSRRDESYWLTELLSQVSIDFTDVTLVSKDTRRTLYLCDPDDPDNHDNPDDPDDPDGHDDPNDHDDHGDHDDHDDHNEYDDHDQKWK